jgi:hypothetical protein
VLEKYALSRVRVRSQNVQMPCSSPARAKCACGWQGTLYTSLSDNYATAKAELHAHRQTHAI